MSSKKNYVPRNPDEYDIFFKNIVQYASAKREGARPEWDHVPQKELEALTAIYADWHKAYEPTLKPHTPPETSERNRVKKISEKALREFVNRFLRHPPVTDYDRDIMRIPNRRKTRKSHIEVTEMVSFIFRIKEMRRVWVDFRVEGASDRAKPEGYDGAIIIYAVLDQPPKSLEELTRHAKANRSPYALKFEEAERGKTVYAAMAWQNGRGNLGEWSAIQSTVVP